MRIRNILHKDYTINQKFYQLKLPLNIDYMIPANDSVRLLSQFVEEMDLKDLYSTYSRVRENQVSPRKMLKIMIYGYMNKLYSSRDIENACRRDINFMFLLEDATAPDHATFARFRSLHFAPCAEKILAEMSNFLYDIGEISGEAIFIDGTKIEANANKYTFVWKKAVNKFYEKLKNKINDFESSFNEDNKTQFKDIYEIKEYLEKEISDKNIEFIHGKGTRKTQQQKDYETLISYIEKENEYTEHLKICGTRNSYSKTDKDATFMRMKEDYMKNGQLKPAYNLQIGVNSEYIVGLDLYSNPTDVKTLLPFLSILESKNLKFKNIVADAGYESEENYEYLFNNNYTSYIKPQNYESQKTRKFKQDISKVENMKFDKENDTYTCANNQKLTFKYILKKKNKTTGYMSEKRVYESNNCDDCLFSEKCKKTPHNKLLYVADRFLKFRKKSQENITTEQGILLRLNRSIQVEGAFGVLKENMKFKRFKYREKEKTKVEILLFALGYNLRKYIHKREQKREGMKLHKLIIN